MNTATRDPAPPTRLADYRAPAWTVDEVALEFDLDFEHSEVAARLVLRGADPTQPLELDGEELELLSATLDGQALAPDACQADARRLTIHGARDGSVLETRVRIRPAANTALVWPKLRKVSATTSNARSVSRARRRWSLLVLIQDA